MLAAAKLAPLLTGQTHEAEFPTILMQSPNSSSEDDFIEVHIYGAVHRGTVKCLALRQANSGADKVIIEHLIPVAMHAGIDCKQI
jgi:hypothetical protein